MTAKPVDLVAMRETATWHDGFGRRRTAKRIRAMADEIEALRDAIRIATDMVQGGAFPVALLMKQIDRLRALLPTS